MATDTTDRSTYRPTNDAYTGMLGISLVALIAGCIFLFLDYSQYPDRKAPDPPKAASPLEKAVAPAPKAAPAPPAPTPEEKKDDENKQ